MASEFPQSQPTHDTSRIRGTTRLLGLLGYPVGHSLSPAMHNSVIAALGLDLVYVPLSVAPADLARAVSGLSLSGFVGFNVTIPHKQAVLPLVRVLGDEARLAGAVNTLRVEPDGSLSGTNTDIAGFLTPLTDLTDLRDLKTGTATILGAGGSALAVAMGCARLGFRRIQVVGRDRTKLAAFVQQLSAVATVHSHTWQELPALLEQTDLLVNTTPIGMSPDDGASPVGDLDSLRVGAVVYDLIYRPRPTRLLQLARSRGLRAIDGLAMLTAQAEAAFTYWTGRVPPPGLMRSAALRQLGAS